MLDFNTYTAALTLSGEPTYCITSTLLTLPITPHKKPAVFTTGTIFVDWVQIKTVPAGITLRGVRACQARRLAGFAFASVHEETILNITIAAVIVTQDEICVTLLAVSLRVTIHAVLRASTTPGTKISKWERTVAGVDIEVVVF